MGIVIKGMEMPTSCSVCWALDDYGDYPRCRITEEQRGYNFPIREKRMDKCPLAPAADVAPVVRCGECKHWKRIRNDCILASCELDALVQSEDFFCADGERKDGDGDV